MVIVEVVMVEGAIGSENMIVIMPVVGTPVASLTGVWELTVGGVVSPPPPPLVVVKVNGAFDTVVVP